MKIINTDELVLFGPGSDWLWFMLQFFALTVTFFAIYRQLRLQASQGAIEQLTAFENEWTSERMIRWKLEVLVALRDGADPDALPPEWARIAGFWERVGALVRAGHVDRVLLWNGSGTAAITWWATLADTINEARNEGGGRTAMENFE